MTESPPHALAHNLSTLQGVRHGFFGRKGGVSTGLYESLNIGQGSDDDVQSIRDNRDLIRSALGAEKLLSCFQVHSAKVITVTEPWHTRPQADAMVSDKAGLALCILSADCVPVLSQTRRQKLSAQLMPVGRARWEAYARQRLKPWRQSVPIARPYRRPLVQPSSKKATKSALNSETLLSANTNGPIVCSKQAGMIGLILI